MRPFELVVPDSLEEAVRLLDPEDPTVRVMSGGTALMLMMKSDVFVPTRLISLRGIEAEHSRLEVRPDGSFHIGAMVTLAQLEHSAALAGFAPVIPETMRILSNVRIRNMATVGGALAHGDPHMDLPPVLIALDATVNTIGPDGARSIRAEDLHAGYYQTVLEPDELIRDVVIAPQTKRRATYLKCTTRAAKDWPALGVAVSTVLSEGDASEVRLVIGSVGDRPVRIAEAEGVLEGRALTPETIRKAAEAAADTVETNSDELGSAAYKKELVRVYVERALKAVADPVNEVLT